MRRGLCAVLLYAQLNNSCRPFKKTNEQILYSGKLLREKTFVNFTSFVAIRVKVFFTKFEGVASFGGTSEQSIKIFSGKKFFFYQFAKVFSRESFRLYGKQYGLDFLLSY